MKKCVIIPDSFKGSLSSIEVCNIIKEKVEKFFPKCNAIMIPIADGGEGTVDTFIYSLKAEKVSLKVKNAFGEITEVYYGRIKNKAIIEVAQVVGLTKAEGRENPSITSTYGVGEIINHAVENGCNEIFIGLGGSSTNDSGVGAAAALGTVFKDKNGKEFIPVGKNLNEVEYIDISKTLDKLKNCKVTAMCDIDNPMYGKNGAAFVFAPQKGAEENMVKMLDNNLRILSEKIKKNLNKDVSKIKGSGAAGAFGAGVCAFFNGELKSGIEIILDLIGFDNLIKNADMIFTGEGQIDSQSLNGKVVIGISKRAKKQNIPVIVITGSIGEGAEKAYDKGVSCIFSINQRAEDYSTSRFKAKENLEKTIDSILRYYNVISKK